jgi:uncharacterized secreted protein with C-terminal beta-propeller domain
LLDPTNQRLINKFIEQLGDIHANSWESKESIFFLIDWPW